MQSSRARALTGVAALAVVVVLFVVLQSGGDNASTTTGSQTAATGQGSEIPTIVIKDGQPVGGVQQLSFTQGDPIRFRVESDVSDEVHLHGYDVGKDVKAGGSVTFDVPGTDAGVFEVELEQRVVPIAEITVNPA
jgi:hypothetical protein